MSETEGCPLGEANKARIINVEKAVVKIEGHIEKLTNHYAKRPRWFVSILITALVGMVVFLAQYIITHL